MPCVVSGKDALVLVVEMRPDSTVRGVVGGRDRRPNSKGCGYNSRNLDAILETVGSTGVSVQA